jgi:formylglycine-generating enzyme required for sulfatase activity
MTNMGTKPWSGKSCVLEQEDCPAVYISWNGAVEFCNLMKNMNPGKTFRLPTEAEWEYACKADKGNVDVFYYFGDDTR